MSITTPITTKSIHMTMAYMSRIGQNGVQTLALCYLTAPISMRAWLQKRIWCCSKWSNRMFFIDCDGVSEVDGNDAELVIHQLMTSFCAWLNCAWHTPSYQQWINREKVVAEQVSRNERRLQRIQTDVDQYEFRLVDLIEKKPEVVAA